MQQEREARGTIWIILAFVLLWILYTGYQFGSDNHNEQLPFVARLLDPHFLQHDWFVNANDRFTHRTPYSWLMALPARAIGLEAAFALVYLITICAQTIGVFRLCMALWNCRGTALCGAAITLFNTFGTLGNSSLMASMLLPGFISTALAIWAMVWLIEGKWGSALLLLIAGIIHALIGPETALLMVAASLLAKGQESQQVRRFWPLWGVAITAPLAMAWLSQHTDTPLSHQQLITSEKILVFVRHPWHYVPWTWSRESWLGFAGFCLLFFVARRASVKQPWLDAFALVTALFIISGILPLIYEPLLSLAKLQQFRLTIWGQFAGGLFIAHYVWKQLKSGSLFQRSLGALILATFIIAANQPWAIVAVGLVAFFAELALTPNKPSLPRTAFSLLTFLATAGLGVCLVYAVQLDTASLLVAICVVLPLGPLALEKTRLAVATGVALCVISGLAICSSWRPTAWPSPVNRLATRVNPYTQYYGAEGEIAWWAKHHTPQDAVFLIPPHMENFRWQAQRAIVADFKTFPWSDAGLLEWRQRMNDLCGGRELEFGNTPYPILETAYGGLTSAQLRDLCRRYQASYVLLDRKQKFDGRLLHENEDWRLYKVD